MAIKNPSKELTDLMNKLARMKVAEKIVPIKAKVAAIYVPKSDRVMILQSLVGRLDGAIYDDSSEAESAVGSSIGGIKLPSGLYIAAKPDGKKQLREEEHETLQSVYLALALNTSDTTFDYSDLQTMYDKKKVQTSVKLSTIYEKAGKGWHEASRLNAIEVARTIGKKDYIVCHRSGSKFVDNISNAAQKLISQTLEGGERMGLDKWNPSDCWVVKKNMLKHDFSQYTSILDLNEFLLKSFKDKSVVGVSLKQSKGKAKVEIFNAGAKKQFKYTGYTLGKDFVNFQGVTVKFEPSGTFSVRLFGKISNGIGEINGKTAQGGKVSNAADGPLAKIMRKYDKKYKAPKWQDCIKMYKTKPQFVYKVLFDYMKDLMPAEARKYKSVKEFGKAVENRKKGGVDKFIVSKWHSCEFLTSLLRQKPAIRNDMIKSFIGYAASETEISSIFIKVS